MNEVALEFHEQAHSTLSEGAKSTVKFMKACLPTQLFEIPVSGQDTTILKKMIIV